METDLWPERVRCGQADGMCVFFSKKSVISLGIPDLFGRVSGPSKMTIFSLGKRVIFIMIHAQVGLGEPI